MNLKLHFCILLWGLFGMMAKGQYSSNKQINNQLSAADIHVAAAHILIDSDSDGIDDSLDFDDDNDGITDAAECLFCTAVPIVNPGFEVPNLPGSAGVHQVSENTAGVGWQTTAPDGLIEYWTNGFEGIFAAQGDQIIELNGNSVATLYQSICFGPGGGTVNWSVKHRGRWGTDVAVVKLGSSLATATVQATMTDPNTAWGMYSGVYIVPPGTTTLLIIFQSVSAFGGNPTVGNLLDDVVVTTQQNCVDTDGDGIINALDLDSDGDGCSDVIEGSMVFNGTYEMMSSLPGGNSGPGYTGTSSMGITKNLGTTIGSGLSLGIPVVAGLGQAIGTSQNVNAQDVFCCITNTIIPTFNVVGPYCGVASIAALPTTSTNSIIGTWSPAFSNNASGTYTFTPTPGQCALPTTLSVVINTPPSISVVQSCNGGVNVASITTTATPGMGGNLFYTVNGATSLNGNATSLINGNYTVVVTEFPSGCSASQIVNINCFCPGIVIIGSSTICAGNSTTFSMVGGATGGLWTISPATAGTISSSGVFVSSTNYSGTVLVQYAAAGCSGLTGLVVNPAITPLFSVPSSICSGAALAPLPATSTNGIAGAWSPTINPTTTTIYTFTPSAGQCATTTTQTINVNPNPTVSVTTNCVGGANSGTLTTTATAGAGGTLSYTINGTGSPNGNGTALANGPHTVQVTESPSGCTASQTVTVNCNCPTITVSGSASVCAGASATFTQAGGASAGAWSVAPALAGSITAAGVFTSAVGYNGTATITYSITGCTGSLSVQVNTVVTPSFTQVAAICSGAALAPLPATSTNGIAGAWSPTINPTTTTIYTFTPIVGQCATTTTQTITVNPKPTVSVTTNCVGGANSGTLTTTATAGAGGTLSYTINGTGSPNGNGTALANGPYTVQVTESPSGCTASQTVAVNCNCPTITVSGSASVCAGASATFTQAGGASAGAWSVAPALAGSITAAGVFTSAVGYNGTATITYSITGCTGSLSVQVNTVVTPSFTQVAAICSGAALAPLPATSTNGIAGAWSPTINPTTTTTYIFTPNAGQCATTTTQTITINPNPTISVTTNCVGGANSGTLTTTATAGAGGTLSYTINGTGSPNGNGTALANGPYTVQVTESPSGCTASQTVTVNCNCPTITVSGSASVCAGASATFTQAGGASAGAWSVAPALAGSITAAGVFTSAVGYNGTATITYSITGCTGSLSVQVNTVVTPSFTQVAAICSGAALAPLPATSTNGIAGAWSPTINPTTTTIYTFTPIVGQCATTTTQTITVNPKPTVSVTTNCVGGANSGTLTTTATAGAGGTLSYTINGTGSPNGNGTALANGPYTVQVTESPSGCTASQTVAVNCNCPSITVSGSASVCAGASATYTQVGGASAGTWSVAPALAGSITAAGVFTSAVGYSGSATITYSITGCTGFLSVQVNTVVTPSFTQVAGICLGAALAPLPTTSTNSITGAWSPAINPTTTTTYTFTPNAGQCATTTTQTINVNPNPTVSVSTNCIGGANTGTLTTTATAGAGGTLNYTINGTGSPNGNGTALANGPYTVQVTESPSGCTASQTVAVNCNCPTITVSGSANVCAGASATFTQAGGASAGAWSVAPALAGSITAAGVFTSTIGYSGSATITYSITGCTGFLSVQVNIVVAPSFTQAAAICSGAALAPLPTTSTNSITGAWSPAINPTLTTTYTFTPNAGQCATTTTQTINVNPNPTVSVTTNCIGGANTGTLTTTATAGAGGTLSYTINGTGSPNGNGTALANGPYTVQVTESPFGCTVSQTVAVNCNCPTITVSGSVAICSDASAIYTQIGGSAGGTWSVTPSNAGDITPVGEFTSSISFVGSATIFYTVAGCNGLFVVQVNAIVTPSFTQVPPICSGVGLAPLPTTSTNGITGAWSPAINPTTTTTYIFTPEVSTTNLVVNGDFSLGNIGFTTDYQFLNNAGLNGVQKAYGIVATANAWFQFFPPCTGPTPTADKMMVVDGSTSNGGNDKVWGQTIAVVPNQDYTFSYWLQTIALPNPAQIEVKINGISLGMSIAPATNCEWVQVSYIWNSGLSTSASIAIVDKIIIANGNDFSVDDITFYSNTSQCANKTTMTITVHALPTLQTSNVDESCGLSNGQISATVLNGGTQPYTYSINNQPFTSLNVFDGLSSSSYTLAVIDANGCADTAIVTIDEIPGITDIAVQSTTENCNTNNATLTFGAVDGGLPPYIYSFAGSPYSNTLSYNSLSAGEYVLAVQDISGCQYFETFFIDSVQSFNGNVIANNPNCQSFNSGLLLVEVPSDYPPYMVSLNGASSTTMLNYTNLVAGSYSLVVEDAIGCQWDTAFTLVAPLALDIDLGTDIAAEYNDLITLFANVNKPLAKIDTLIWTPTTSFTCPVGQLCFDQTLVADSNTPSVVVVHATDIDGCIASDTLQLTVSFDYNVYVPNIFTPGTNGSNTAFTIYGDFNIVEIRKLQIFDRWGGMVFDVGPLPPNNPTYGWEGTTKGEKCNVGVYVYWAELLLADGTIYLIKGDVLLD